LPKCVLRLQRNCPFWTYFSKLSTEDMLVSASVDAASYVLLPISQLPWEQLEKGSLTKTCHEYVTHSTKELMVLTSLSNSCFGFVSSSLLVVAASALLASASAPSSIWRGLGRRSIWAPFWCGARVRTPGYRSWSVQARTLNSAATRALGVPGGINCRQ
jgi:hypothetical protein